MEESDLLFFLISLIVSLLLTLIVLGLLGRSLSVNWEMRNRKPIGYLMPVLLMLILIYLSLTQSVPRLLDTVAVLSRTCPIEEILVEDDDSRQISLPGGQKLAYSRLQYEFLPGRSYLVTYTPKSFYVIEVTEIAESAARE